MRLEGGEVVYVLLAALTPFKHKTPELEPHIRNKQSPLAELFTTSGLVKTHTPKYVSRSLTRPVKIPLRRSQECSS